MARIIIIRNFYSYNITKSPSLDNMDGSDAILCWQSTNHHVRLLLVCIYGVSVVVDEPPCPTFISMYIWCFGGITVIMLLNLHH